MLSALENTELRKGSRIARWGREWPAEFKRITVGQGRD